MVMASGETIVPEYCNFVHNSILCFLEDTWTAFFCSNRGNREGCGCSFSVFEKDILPSFSINASVFSLFLKAYLEHLNVHAAWQPLAHYFSLSSAYRLWKRFGHGPQQASLRERPCRNRAPPQCTSKEPREQLIRHLFEAFKEQEDPIAAFQAEFQIPFWN